MSPADGSPLLLDATLRPNPPMSWRTLMIVLIADAAINFAIGLAFMLHGAWPMMPFLGADVALLAWAFWATQRAARRFEHITITASALHVVCQPVKGNPVEIELNPYWVRVEMDDPPKPASLLTLRSHGKTYPIGSFLPYLERYSFAQLLKSTLRQARETLPGSR